MNYYKFCALLTSKYDDIKHQCNYNKLSCIKRNERVKNLELVTRKNLSKVKIYDEFFALRQSIYSLGSENLFDLLFPIAITYESDGASSVAGMLLIEFDPKARISCHDMVLEIANSKWYLSDMLIPFYMVTQFGKSALLECISETLNNENLTKDQRVKIEGIRYWAEMPASSLCEDLFYFEWQEAIEGTNA